MNTVRTQQHVAAAPLEKGQIWLLKGQQLEVKHVGKHLVEFMLTRKPMPVPVQRHIRVAKQLESIKTVLKFLRAHRAVLGRNRSSV